MTSGFHPRPGVDIYDAYTGRYRCVKYIVPPDVIQVIDVIGDSSADALIPWLTPDGRQIWGVSKLGPISARGWQIIEDSESGVTRLQP